MLVKVSFILLSVLLILSGCSAKTTPLGSDVSSSQSSKSVSQTSVISSPEAKNYIGKRVTVEFMVADSRFASTSRGNPTFLNDKSYPNHQFTVVIWGKDRGKFGSSPERTYKGKRIRATGLIESYQGKPQIVADDASQIQVMD